jgi:hypothetical protein
MGGDYDRKGIKHIQDFHRELVFDSLKPGNKGFPVEYDAI